MSSATRALSPEFKQLIETCPKAELHIHIEGSLEPEMIFALAKRNQVSLPYASVESLKAAYAFEDLQSFLDIYYAGASVLLKHQDFYDMAYAYLKKAHAQGVVHAEIFFDPQTHTARGVAMQVVIEGLSRALVDAGRDFKISANLILCFLRHLDEDSALQTLQEALPYRQHFIGVGLDSSEIGHPPEKFKNVFEKARALGLHCVAHAGEEAPPAYIWSALQTLYAQRIDHGVQAMKDPALMDYLARTRTPLTVCPVSNVRLCVFAQMEDHPIKKMLDLGLCVMINSDDPAYFGGYINENYLQVAQSLSLSPADIEQLAKCSFEASFMPEALKRHWLAEVDRVFA
jgi:adenosine deaminase